MKATVRKKHTEEKVSKQEIPIPEFSGWDKIPDMDVPPFSLLVFAEPGTGKTHLACTFPSPALGDTETKGWRVAKKFPFVAEHYKQVKDYPEIRSFVDKCLTDNQIHTVIIDSSKDLRVWAELTACKELGRENLFGTGGTVMWSHCYEKIDGIMNDVKRIKKNLVFVARMKDEYVDDKPTGNLIYDGYTKAPYQCDVVLNITRGMRHSKYGVVFKDQMFARVIKNGEMLVTMVKPYLIDVSYNGIVTELINGEPWEYTVDDFIEQVYTNITGNDLAKDFEEDRIARRFPKNRVKIKDIPKEEGSH